MFHIPATTISSLKHPGPLMTSEPGSFAHNTFKVRVPRILDEIVELNRFPSEVLSAMRSLRNEIMSGHINPITEQAIDQMFWNTASEPWIGKSWLEAPWYWAESYFYRRVLEACHYFQPGERYLIDPYTPQKMSELAPDAAPHTLAIKLTALPQEQPARITALLHNSLWGNRTDLSYNVANTLGTAGVMWDAEPSANLLVDDSAIVLDKLLSPACRQVTVITDNAGTELLMDLALVDELLSCGLVERVEMVLKEQPFFVSDAMVSDMRSTIAVMQKSPEPLHSLGMRLEHYIDAGRLVLTSHWFFTTCLFYAQMPPDLRASLGRANLVILKGDANYRRLLSDACWLPATSFAKATDYFPAPFVALRTLKAEIIVGLPEGAAERLTQQDPDWRVNGRRGVIQMNTLE